MMSVGARTWKVVKPHIPLIKFRYGSKEPHSAINHNPTSQMQSSPKSNSKVQSQTVDESQLPAKYLRKPMSQLEMETIERGGPE